ncbi:Protein of unknown function DUF262 [Rhodovulum sp. ES.010]|uniref:DUF262 domain-containing protein n=1 Tax=Rhodovulum sp. ES.010 TaxID=1882821 RepID=UPI00092C66BC|nr:DUF262 domain-containing protein [Rhodovulum sp. ES.010]SIO54277.1 Protein of unknown function DUF262 [Rhodovulum sp. ES.010]
MDFRDEQFEYEDQSEGTDDYKVSQEDFEDLVIIPSDWTVSTIAQHLKGDINVDPDFQRRGVWNKTAKSRFIESLFLGIPIPQILLSEEQKRRGAYIVLDGKQRLTTIREFLDGRLDDGRTFTLSGLDNLTELNNRSWEDLSANEDYRRALESATIRTAILKNWKNESVLYEIFYRLNSGSVKLSPMELRMALFRGPFLKKVIKWTETLNELHSLLRLKMPDKRMNDVELTVRHLAFQDSAIPYKGNLKDFLDQYCAHMNANYDEDIVQGKLENLLRAVSAAREVWGHQAVCRRWQRSEKRFDNRFNRAIFDIQIGSMSNSAFREWATASKQRKNAVVNAFVELYETDSEFVTSVESTTKSITASHKRFSTWYKKVEEISQIKLEIPNIPT